MLLSQTYDIIVNYEDGVLSVSKWFVIIVVAWMVSTAVK